MKRTPIALLQISLALLVVATTRVAFAAEQESVKQDSGTATSQTVPAFARFVWQMSRTTSVTLLVDLALGGGSWERERSQRIAMSFSFIVSMGKNQKFTTFTDPSRHW